VFFLIALVVLFVLYWTIVTQERVMEKGSGETAARIPNLNPASLLSW
jgi:hypothetical protein